MHLMLKIQNLSEILPFIILLCSLVDGAVFQKTLTSHDGWISSVAWSPKNQFMLVSGSYDQTLILWDTRRFVPIIVKRINYTKDTNHLLNKKNEKTTIFKDFYLINTIRIIFIVQVQTRLPKLSYALTIIVFTILYNS